MFPNTSISLPTESLPALDLSQVDTTIVRAINPTIVWLVLILGFLLIAILTVILRWHWKKYTLNTKAEKKATRIYFAGITIAVVALIAIGVLYIINYPS